MGWVLLAWGAVVWGGACVEPSLTGKVDGGLNGSKGLACEKASDCWDGLACQDGVCGGKPAEATPEKEATPEQTTPEEPNAPEKTAEAESTQEAAPTETAKEGTTPEAIAEISPEPTQEAGQCQGNVNAQGFCAQDSDCCTGQTCGSFPFGAQTLRLCTACKTNTDCPKTTQCCSFGAISVCALQCAPPQP
jgi:hypothetical protein